MKNILICSFPRSGTHFLINSIAANFEYYSNHRHILPITDQSEEIVNFLHDQKKNRRIYKSHCQSYSFSDAWDLLFDKWYIFYIVRDGKDAITSLWNLYKKRDRKKEIGSVGDFMRSCPPKKESAYKVAIRKPESVVQMWNYHIESWLSIDKKKLFFIHYSDLLNDFERTIMSIADVLNLRPNSKLRKPSKYKNVIMPGSGINGNWMKFFTKKDLDYFHRETRPASRLISLRFLLSQKHNET